MRRQGSFTLQPRQSSHPLPQHFLDGAKGWDKLRARDCVIIETVPFQPRFAQIENLSPEPLELLVRPAPKRETVLKVKPGKKSKTVDVRSIAQRRRLRKLVEKDEAAVIFDDEIGPALGYGRAVGSYGTEGVYRCYECGGPIVFRGHPPRPIHIFLI